MKLFKILKAFLIISFTHYAYAQQADNLEEKLQNTASSYQKSIELNYQIFSPEILFRLGDDIVSISPKAAGQPGLRFTRGNFSLSINNSLFSGSAKSGGFELAYDWDDFFVQAYHVWASGYRVRLNPDSDTKKDLDDRENMKGSSTGVLVLKGFEESSHFSMMTDRGPRDLESVSSPLQYIYQVLIDRSVFEDSSAFVAGDTVQRKERTFFLPGLGAMISQSAPAGYVFSSCSLGLGAIKETMVHTTGISEEKTDGAYAISCLINLVLQKQKAQIQAEDLRWYGGMTGNVQVIQPFDKALLGQRLFLAGVFVGAQF